MSQFSTVNPFYRIDRDASFPISEGQKPTKIYAELPACPRTASPVPHLTSLYHFNETGTYGNRSYPGNCSGYIIKDLIQFFRPATVFDPMSGSGTCGDVCRDLAIPCVSLDLKSGFDATDPAAYAQFLSHPGFDFIWAHPPYWRQIVYSDQPNDLSRAPSLEHFLHAYKIFISECSKLLAPGGKLVILMGDYPDRQSGFVPLTYYTKQLAFEAGLRQSCIDIIRFVHGATSSRKNYRTSFIPTLHDMCMVFEKRES